MPESKAAPCRLASVFPLRRRLIRDVENAASPLQRALKSLIDQVSPAPATIIVSLPAEYVVFRSLTVPFKEDNKIRQILPFELEPIVPVPIDGLTIDFQKLPMGDQSSVFAVAVNSSVLQDHLECFTEINLQPRLVVPGGFPLALQIIELDTKATGQTLILDIDSEKTTLFALASGHIEMVRTLPMDTSTEAGIESLALRVRQTVTALGEGQETGFSPVAVYVTGPGLSTRDCAPQLSRFLDLPVATIDLRRLLTSVDMDNRVHWDPHFFNGALALAYLDVEGRKCPNFHRISSPLRNFWTAYRAYLFGPMVLLAIVLLMGLSSVLIDSYYLKKQVDIQNSQLVEIFKSTFPDSRLTAPPLDQMKSKLKEVQQGNLAPQNTGSAIRTVDILLEVSQRVPRSVNVTFSRMTVGSEAVTISGETPDFNTVDDIKSRIEKSSLFKQVTIASANMDKSGQTVRFKLKIDL